MKNCYLNMSCAFCQEINRRFEGNYYTVITKITDVRPDQSTIPNFR